MATREMFSRSVTWVCRTCGETNVKPNGVTSVQTTKSAEEHADEKAHTVIAVGQVFYLINAGKVQEDDPFAPR